MKKITQLIILLFVIAVTIQSCKKDSSNPTQPKVTQKDLLIGLWSVDSVYRENVKSELILKNDLTVEVGSKNINIYRKGSLIGTYYSWNLDESIQTISFYLSNGQAADYYLIYVNEKYLHWYFYNDNYERVDQYFRRM